MPLPNLFKGTKKKTSDADDAPKFSPPNSPRPSTDSRSGSRSPDKKSASPQKTGLPKPGSHSTTSGTSDKHRRTDSQHSSRKSKPPSPTKRNSHRYDPNSHPLNLPPEELRRLSAMSVASEQHPVPPDTNMDREFTASPTPSSPMNGSVPGAFPQPNGSASKVNGDAPRPPPHRTPTSPPPSKNPTSPPAANPEAAEAFKANGNKFFKAKDYSAAIREYTKGITNQPDFGEMKHEIDSAT